MVVLDSGSPSVMSATSNNQYLSPDYLSPLPSSLDAKNSPLALLAQTCSQIGADSSNPKPVLSGGGSSDKTKKSAANHPTTNTIDSRMSSSTSSVAANIVVNYNNNNNTSSSKLYVDQHQQRKSPENKSVFKPYETNVLTKKVATTSSDSSLSSLSSSSHLNLIRPASRSVDSGFEDRKSSSSRTSSRKSASSSPRNSGSNCSAEKPSSPQQDAKMMYDGNNGKSIISRSSSPHSMTNSNHNNNNNNNNNSTAMPLLMNKTSNNGNDTVYNLSSKDNSSSNSSSSSSSNSSTSSSSISSSSNSNNNNSSFKPTATTFACSLSPLSGASSNAVNNGGYGCCPTPLDVNPAFRSPFAGGGGGHYPHHPAALLEAAACFPPSAVSVAAAAAAAASSSFFNYARVKNAAGNETIVPVCKDPYCLNCRYTAHHHGALGGAPCPPGCVQCDQKYSAAAAAAALMSSHPLSYQYTRPFMCSWISGDSYCGKRFRNSDELLQHLRTHTNTSEALAFMNQLRYPQTVPSSASSSSSSTIGSNALSHMHAAAAAVRYHPYSKPGLPISLTASPFSAFNPTLNPYYPYSSLYDQRIGAAVNP